MDRGKDGILMDRSRELGGFCGMDVEGVCSLCFGLDFGGLRCDYLVSGDDQALWDFVVDCEVEDLKYHLDRSCSEFLMIS